MKEKTSDFYIQFKKHETTTWNGNPLYANGYRIGNSYHAFSDNPDTKKQEPKVLCLHCGRKVDNEIDLCPSCGAPMPLYNRKEK